MGKKVIGLVISSDGTALTEMLEMATMRGMGVIYTLAVPGKVVRLATVMAIRPISMIKS